MWAAGAAWGRPYNGWWSVSGGWRPAATMLRIVRRIGYQWFAHDNASSAAAIAFYSLFTMAPTLVFGVSLGKWALGQADAQAALRSSMVQVMTPRQADALLSLIGHDELMRGGIVASVLAGLLLLYGASKTFAQIRVALNRIFGLSAETIREQIHTTLVGRLLAAIFLIVVGALELAVITFNVAIAHMADKFGHLWWVSAGWLQIVTYASSWLVVGLVFTGLLRYLPIRSPRWRHVLPGAAISLVLFQIGKYLISWYLSRAVIASAYGTSSSLVAIMIWVYYSSQTLLLGGEVTHYMASRHGAPQESPEAEGQVSGGNGRNKG
jgi:membrane protein